MADNKIDFNSLPVIQDAQPMPDLASLPVIKTDDGEALPDYANGLSPETAINRSPVEISDRLKLSVGNERGSLKYLKERFEDATVIKGSSDFAVKKDGFWHRVDPEGWGDKNPWEVTRELLFKGDIKPLDRMVKEIASDAADVAPILGAVAASAGAAVATGGTSVVAQTLGAGAAGAAFAGAKTSLGRLAGTYEATPEEQIKDVAYESALNMVGVGFTAGVKPSAAFIANKVPFIAKAYNGMTSGTKEVIKNVYGKLSGTGSALDEISIQPQAVKAAMLSGHEAEAAGGNFVNSLTVKNINHLKGIAKQAGQTLDELWTKMSSGVVNAVDDKFVGNATQLIDDVYMDAAKSGLGKFVVRGKEVPVAELVNGLPKGAKFILRSPKEIQAMQAASGSFNDVTNLAIDAEGYGQMAKFFSQLQGLTGYQNLSGKRGAQELLNLKKLLGDVTYTVKSQADEAGLNVVTRAMARYNDIFKTNIGGQFERAGLGQEFNALNASFSGLKGQVAPLQKALQQSQRGGGDSAFQTLLNQIGSQDGKNVVQKLGIESLYKAAQEHGLSSAAGINAAQMAIRANQAAIAFNPLVRNNLIGQGSATAAIGSAVMGNPMMAGVATAAGVVTSPRLALYNAQLAQSLWKGKDFLSSLTKDQLNKFVSDPRLVNSFAQSIVQAPSITAQTESQLLRGQR